MIIDKNEINLILNELFSKTNKQDTNAIISKIKELKYNLESEKKVNESLRGHIQTLKNLSQSTELLSSTEKEKLSIKNSQLEYYIEVQQELKKENKKLIDELQKRTDELKNLNEELETRNTELDQFSYIASHDLKSPLRAISFLSKWVLEDKESSFSEIALNNMQLIQSRVKRLEGHLTSLFEYSKIGRGTRTSEFCNVKDLVEDIYEIIEKPESCSIELSSLPIIYAPAVVLNSIFMNLMTNSIKHNDKNNCKISISYEDSIDFYKFYVRDNGPGIETKNQEIIFDFFKTLKSRDKVEGSGLGLTIVKKYVHGYGGTVGVESSKIGLGTCFYFTWPKNCPEQSQNSGLK